MRRAIVILVGLAVAVSACGGDEGSTVPDGYKTYSKAGVSFAYPPDWDVAERTDAEGAPAVEITPPDKDETPYGLIQLSISPDAGDRFESLAEQRRIVIREVNDGTIDSDEEADVPGAEEALRTKTTTPPRQGNDPVEVKADSLDVLRGNGDVIVFTVASPQREGQEFDPAAIVDSFRLEDE